MQSGIYAGLDTSVQFSHHRLHYVPEQRMTFDECVDADGDSIDILSVKQQEHVINLLPNDSALHGRGNLRRTMYFSCCTLDEDDHVGPIHKPSSLRNLVIFQMRHHKFSEVNRLLSPTSPTLPSSSPLSSHTISPSCPSSSPLSSSIASTSSSSASSSLQSATSARTRHGNAIDDIYMPNVPDVPNTDCATPSTPYALYKQNLMEEYGVLEWRLHQDTTDVVAMNDVDLNTGIFMKNSFVHTSRQVLDGIHKVEYQCSCKMFSTVLRLKHSSQGSVDNSHTCVHVRFFSEELEPHLDTFFHSHHLSINPSSPLGKKVTHAISNANNAVVRLDNDKRYHRYSVIPSGLVQTCAIVKLESNRFSCQAGLCRAKQGHKRKVTAVGDSTNCPHIQALNTSRELWDEFAIAEEECNDKQVASDDSDEYDDGFESVEPAQEPAQESTPKTSEKVSFWN